MKVNLASNSRRWGSFAYQYECLNQTYFSSMQLYYMVNYKFNFNKGLYDSQAIYFLLKQITCFWMNLYAGTAVRKLFYICRPATNRGPSIYTFLSRKEKILFVRVFFGQAGSPLFCKLGICTP